MKKLIQRRPSPVGINIRRLRDAADLTQEELAKLAGIHPMTISKLETGMSQEADMPTLRGLAKALGVKESEFTDTVAPAPALLDTYLASPWAAIDKPTEEEVAWFRALPGVVFQGVAPSVEAVHHLLMARRAK